MKDYSFFPLYCLYHQQIRFYLSHFKTSLDLTFPFSYIYHLPSTTRIPEIFAHIWCFHFLVLFSLESPPKNVWSPLLHTTAAVKLSNDLPMAQPLSQFSSLNGPLSSLSDLLSLKQSLHLAAKTWHSRRLPLPISSFFSFSFTSSVSSSQPQRRRSRGSCPEPLFLFYLHSLPCGFHPVSTFWHLQPIPLFWNPDWQIHCLLGISKTGYWYFPLISFCPS